MDQGSFKMGMINILDKIAYYFVDPLFFNWNERNNIPVGLWRRDKELLDLHPTFWVPFLSTLSLIWIIIRRNQIKWV